MKGHEGRSCRLALEALAAVLTCLVGAAPAEAACVNPNVGFSGSGSTVRVVGGLGTNSTMLNNGVGRWQSCPTYGMGLPQFTTSNVSADKTVYVDYIAASSGGQFCGTHTKDTSGNSHIKIYAQGLDQGGNLVACQPPDWILSHEIGHLLGLANAPSECSSYIMSPNPGSSVQPAECEAADDQWLTDMEKKLGEQSGGGTITDCPTGDMCSSPIVLDLDLDGFDMTGLDRPVLFDIDGDGTRETLSWTDAAGGDAFLALDRDGDGWITSGLELFGNFTVQPSSNNRNGFHALWVYDQPAFGGNDDGLISSDDRIFRELVLWRDLNHDGESQPGELQSLASHGVAAIELDYVEALRRDRYGNLFRWSSHVQFTVNRRLAASDVILLREGAAGSGIKVRRVE